MIHGVGQGLWSSGEFWPRGGILPSHSCFSYYSVYSIMQTYNQIKVYTGTINLFIHIKIKFNSFTLLIHKKMSIVDKFLHYLL